MSTPHPLPATMADRLIVALDVPEIRAADAMVETLDGLVSFFKIGLWLAFARGVDGLIDRLIANGKRLFLDAKLVALMLQPPQAPLSAHVRLAC